MSRITIRRRKGGFTLIEIMIVVLIIGILLAIAIPNFMRAREVSRAKSCVANLKQIETAKEQWAMDFKMSGTDVPVMADITTDAAASEQGQYIKAVPTCPSGGAYTVGAVSASPICVGGGSAAFPHDLTAAGG